MREESGVFSWLATAILTAAIVIVGACSSNPTTVNYDPGTDFSQYETYAFLADLATDKEQYQSLEATYLRQSVSREFDRLGLRQVAENPDLAINLAIESQEKIRSRSVPTGGYGIGYDPFYDVYGTGWGGGYTTQIDQYTEGKLVIDAIDVKLKKVVWSGSTKGRLTNKDMQNFEQTLDEAVKEIFSESAKVEQQ